MRYIRQLGVIWISTGTRLLMRLAVPNSMAFRHVNVILCAEEGSMRVFWAFSRNEQQTIVGVSDAKDGLFDRSFFG